MQIVSVCSPWLIYHEGLLPATQHLTLFPPWHLPVTILVPQEVLSTLIQAPPPPLHGPLYELSAARIVGMVNKRVIINIELKFYYYKKIFFISLF